MSARLFLGILTISCLPATGIAQQSSPQATTADIDTLLIRAQTSFLSDDLLAGRETGSHGSMIAAAYIRSACIQFGLEPVGESYLHRVPLVRATVDTGLTTLSVSSAVGAGRFVSPDQFTVSAGNTATVRNFMGPAVYVGTEKDLMSLDHDSTDLDGVVAVSVGMLSATTSAGLAGSGAVGLLHLIPDGVTFRRLARAGPMTLLADPATPSSRYGPLPALIGGPDILRAVAELSTPETPAPGTALGLMVAAALKLTEESISANNVACLLRTSEENAIALTAHYDHIGIASPDATGDSIYNGFSDNAAGVAMLLAIADAIRRSDPGPQHSVLFLFFTGEEKGLLGSDYFVAHPPWPLENVVSVINLDAGAPPAKPTSWRIAGGDDSALGTLAVNVAAGRGWDAITSPATPNSDYYPFWRHGVPAVFIIPGTGPYETHDTDSSKALKERWDRYHQAGDEWSDDFPFEGLGRYAEYALLVAMEIDREASSGARAP